MCWEQRNVHVFPKQSSDSSVRRVSLDEDISTFLFRVIRYPCTRLLFKTT